MKKNALKRIKEIADELYKITKEENLQGIWVTTRQFGLGDGSRCITLVRPENDREETEKRFENITSFDDTEGWSDEWKS